ncbi:hypothetical protein FRB94_002275 [Tulasnella sp. JGI-2019a]|nr:hypothetical protein FRB93_004085 [Tulasnella sp. JGI-2019a]KAG9004599.1 hypothetical protein FRB94_002275 [Tulasnella sp. JGI-2019a]
MRSGSYGSELNIASINLLRSGSEYATYISLNLGNGHYATPSIVDLEERKCVRIIEGELPQANPRWISDDSASLKTFDRPAVTASLQLPGPQAESSIVHAVVDRCIDLP